jgi:hypothetical protein
MISASGVLVVAQPAAVLVARQEQVPQPCALRFRLRLFHQRQRLPAIALRDLVPEPGFVRIDVRFHERRQARHKLFSAVRIAEIHWPAWFP